MTEPNTPEQSALLRALGDADERAVRAAFEEFDRLREENARARAPKLNEYDRWNRVRLSLMVAP